MIPSPPPSLNTQRLKSLLEETIQGIETLIRKRQNQNQRYDWAKRARLSQRLPDGDHWNVWMIIAGRGFGKTRTGAETVRQLINENKIKHIGLIGQSIAEAKAVMVFGESGLMNIFPEHERPHYNDTHRRLTFKNGATATLFGGNMPERLRGPQFDFVWIDEMAKFRRPEELFSQVMMGLRLGTHPKCLITTTPRPIPFLEKLMQQSTTIVTRGTTFENEENLADTYIDMMKKTYAQTRMGLQELYAEILNDRDGALWKRDMIRYKMPDNDHWRRIVIAIDPATTHHENSDETGIVVAGIHEDGFVYVLDDLSGRLSPTEWGMKVTEAYWRYKADRVVAEINKGGDLVERVVKSIDPHVSYRAVRATRGKIVRAEPVASLYEQDKIYHIKPFKLLEEQCCEYLPERSSKSPDRMDALVWAITDLLLAREASLMPKIWAG